MTIVSNSDIECMQKCEYMFLYSRHMRLRPKQLPIWIRRGLFGHDLMETFFQSVMDGDDYETACQKTGKQLESIMSDPEAGELMKIYRHVVAFGAFAMEQAHWKVVALEDKAMWDITLQRKTSKEEVTLAQDFSNLVFGFTPDIVVEMTKGVNKGSLAVLDYKFLGQYMSDVAINMAQQIPKYIIYRNKMNGTKIRQGAFVQLNTRATGQDKGHKLFLIKWVEPNKNRLARIELENERLAARVAEMYETPLPVAKEMFNHTVNKDVCDRCFFGKDLCPAELDGRSQDTVDKIIEREYIRNDYGY